MVEVSPKVAANKGRISWSSARACEGLAGGSEQRGDLEAGLQRGPHGPAFPRKRRAGEPRSAAGGGMAGWGRGSRRRRLVCGYRRTVSRLEQLLAFFTWQA